MALLRRMKYWFRYLFIREGEYSYFDYKKKIEVLIEMSSKMIKIILLKDFALLGYKGEIVQVQEEYAHSYLFPNGVATDTQDKKMVYELQEELEHKNKAKEYALSREAKEALYRYNAPSNGMGYKISLGKLPPMSFKVYFMNGRSEKIRWEWYPPHRLSKLPADYKFVLLFFKGRRYLATLHYLQTLTMRKVRSALIVDGSNLGWTQGRPSMDPIFDLYEYISNKSEKFFFPIIWAFDRSFKRKLTKTEKKELAEFCSWSGTKVVDYADEEIFRMAKVYNTGYIFSQDHFNQYHTENYTRISYR